MAVWVPNDIFGLKRIVMSNLHQYSVKLYKNNFSEDENSYYARPAAYRTLSIDNVAESAVERGSATVNQKTMVTAVNEWFEEALYEMMDGFSVNNGYFIMSLTMQGTFTGVTDSYDTSRHSLEFSIVPTDSTKNELENVIVSIDGLADTEPKILQITDMSNGNLNSTITPGKNLYLDGSRLKVVGDDSSCGVYLTNNDDGTQTQLSGYDLQRNMPSELLVLVPSDLTSGSYTVSVTTQFCNSSTTVKSPRTVEFGTTLTVG